MITGILLGDGLTRKNQWQVLKFRGKPLLSYPLEAMIESNLDQIILVLGKDYHRILNNIRIPKTNRIRVVMNRRFDRGISSYLKAAVNLVGPETESVLIARGEYPLLKASLIDRMIDFHKNESTEISIPTYEGQDGHPRVFARRFFPNLLKTAGNDVGESVAAKFTSAVRRHEVKNPGVIKGIDSIQELETVDSVEIDRQERAAHATDSVILPGGTLTDRKAEPVINSDTAEMQKEKDTAEMEPGISSFSTDSITDCLDVSDVPDVTSSAVRLDSDSICKALAIPEITPKTPNKPAGPDSSPSPDLSLKSLNDMIGKNNRPAPPEKSTPPANPTTQVKPAEAVPLRRVPPGFNQKQNGERTMNQKPGLGQKPIMGQKPALGQKTPHGHFSQDKRTLTQRQKDLKIQTPGQDKQ